MKKTLTSLLLIICALPAIAQDTIYVSNRGNNYGNGTAYLPYPSLNQALHAPQAFRNTKDSLIIIVEKGDYYITETIKLNQKYQRPIKVQGNVVSKPRLIGGIQITDWENYKGNIYRAFVPEARNTSWYFEQLYINGHWAEPCKAPNDGWIEVQQYEQYENSGDVIRKITVNPSDLIALKDMNPKKASELRFEFIHNWDISRWPSTKIDINKGLLYFINCNMPPLNPIKKGSRMVLYNYLQALDQPGEWYLDCAEGYVYYIPLPEESMTGAKAIAPKLTRLLEIHGQEGSPISNLSFSNISMGFTGHLMPIIGGEYPGQSAAELEAAIDIDYAERISFFNCEFQDTGGSAIWFRNHCNYNNICHCLFTDIGGGGIKLGTTTPCAEGQPVSHGNVFDNNIMHGLGRVIKSGAGILVTNSYENTISHNDIAELYYTGISVGWTWGYNENMKFSPTVRNIISYNHIHHIGWGVTSDMGGIYTLGESKGTVISNNIIHDIQSYDYGGWGIYLDEGSSYLSVKNNLVYNCKNGGFHQHYGKLNTIENNIFALGTFYQLQFTRPENHLSFTFKHNIIYHNSGMTLSGNWAEGDIDMDQNIYYSTGGELAFAGKEWKKWQKKHDARSLIVDPMFTAPNMGNFILLNTTNVRKIGFVPINYTQSGVYGDEAWKHYAKDDNEKIDSAYKKTTIKQNKNKELFITN